MTLKLMLALFHHLRHCFHGVTLLFVCNPGCYVCSAQVGHVQRVSLVPDRTHNMRTLSLKPLLFGEFPVSSGEIHFDITLFWVRVINYECKSDRKWTHRLSFKKKVYYLKIKKYNTRLFYYLQHYEHAEVRFLKL